jgi:hypothetical protein
VTQQNAAFAPGTFRRCSSQENEMNGPPCPRLPGRFRAGAVSWTRCRWVKKDTSEVETTVILLSFPGQYSAARLLLTVTLASLNRSAGRKSFGRVGKRTTPILTAPPCLVFVLTSSVRYTCSVPRQSLSLSSVYARRDRLQMFCSPPFMLAFLAVHR